MYSCSGERRAFALGEEVSWLVPNRMSIFWPAPMRR